MARHSTILADLRVQPLGGMPAFPTPVYLNHHLIASPEYRSEVFLRAKPDQTLLHYTLAGVGMLVEVGQIRRIPAGTGYLIDLAELDPQKVRYYFDPRQAESWECFGMVFAGGASALMVGDLLARYGAVFELPTEHSLLRRLLALCHRPERELQLRASEAAGLISDLLLAVALAGEQRAAEGGQLRLARAAAAELERDLSAQPGVAELARRLGVTREHLTRIFRREYGLPPHEYLNRARIREAGRLLRETELKQSAIAERLGFAGMPTFYRVFRQILGVTPGEYRRRPPVFEA